MQIRANPDPKHFFILYFFMLLQPYPLFLYIATTLSSIHYVATTSSSTPFLAVAQPHPLLLMLLQPHPLLLSIATTLSSIPFFATTSFCIPYVATRTTSRMRL